MISTKNLKILLEEQAAISSRVEDTRNRITQILAEKDRIVAEAKGPDDEAALQKLNLLISQEQMANKQLKVANRGIEGIKVRLLNEANSVRSDALETLRTEQQRLIFRLESKLEEFYPDATERKRVAEHLYAGSGVRQVPALDQIGREIGGFAGSPFNTREFTEVKWAKEILRKATNANAALIEISKIR